MLGYKREYEPEKNTCLSMGAKEKEQNAKTEVGPRDRGVQYNPVPPTHLGEDPKFTPSNPSPTRPSPQSQNQAPSTSKSGTMEACEPKKKEKKETKKKRQKKKKRRKSKEKREQKSTL